MSFLIRNVNPTCEVLICVCMRRWQTSTCTVGVDRCSVLDSRRQRDVTRSFVTTITSTCHSRTATVGITSPRSCSGTPCCEYNVILITVPVAK